MMNLTEVDLGKDVIIKDIVSDDDELRGFLFSLGCYIGESVRLISKKKGGYVLSIKDARYSIDSELARLIEV